MSRALVIIGLLSLFVSPLKASAADPYQIPVIIPLTGPSAFNGQRTQAGLAALEELTNRAGGIAGRPIKFVFQDDQTNPQVAVQLIGALVAQKAPVVLGSSSVGTCQAMAAIAKTGPTVYCISPGVHPEPGSFMFSANISTVDALDVTIRYLRAQGLKRVALITPTDATGQDADRVIASSIAGTNGDVTLVSQEHFNPTDVTVSAQVAKIKASNPQALIAWATGTPAATIFRAVQESGLDIPVVTSYGNSNFTALQQWASFLPRDLLFSVPTNIAPQQVHDPQVNAALNTYFAQLKRMSTRPDVSTGSVWDPAMLVIEALRKYGTGASAEQIRSYIAGLRSWAGIAGRYDFHATPQRGLDRNAVFVSRWDASKESWIAVSGPSGAALK